VTATDKAVGTIYDAAHKHGYVLLITADHGNAEQMKDPKTGNPHTAHTTNVVPFYMVGVGESKGLKFKEADVEEKKEAGTVNESEEEEEDPPALCDVAPTILDIMVRIRLATELFFTTKISIIQGLPIPEEMTGRSLLAHE